MTFLSIEKPRAVYNMISCSEVDISRVVSVRAEPYRERSTKNNNVTIYKNAKMNRTYNAKSITGNYHTYPA